MPVPSLAHSTQRHAISRSYPSAGAAAIGATRAILSVPPLAKNIEIAWECAQYRHYFERLGSFSRYVHFDKRGTGASDRTVPVPSLDTHVDDLRAVMDAAGVDRAFVQGVSEGGPMGMPFPGTYPDRVAGLILDSTAAAIFPPSEVPEAR